MTNCRKIYNNSKSGKISGKCHLILLNVTRSVFITRKHQRVYSFCGVKLEQVESMSYLGVTFNDDLKWSNHVSTISSKASRVLGMMKRNLWNFPKKVKEIAYTTIVRPKLEYACAALDPYLQNHTTSLERVQRKAARFCSNNYHPTPSVTDMLHEFGWTPLELRRTMTRLALLYKMSRGQIDVDTETHLNPNTELRTRASHQYRYIVNSLYTGQSHKEHAFLFFFP